MFPGASYWYRYQGMLFVKSAQLRYRSAVIAIVAACAATPAVAQSINFAIPGQAATTAIPEFGRQANMQILVAGPLVRNTRTTPVYGRLDVRHALDQLLQGTGLTVSSWSNGTVTLVATPPAHDTQVSFDGSVGTAALQSADAAAPTPIGETAQDEIVVTGFRASQANAITLKRKSNTVRESIVAEDIANFPDLNLAESLQRVPGLSITREAGEGRRINVRGMGSDFTRVQLNGMEVLSNSDSPMDSRYQNKRDRSFDFNIFASELFKRVDVEKTYEAVQDEGGMAGTVDLYTPKPFDFDHFTMTGSAQLGTGTNTHDLQRRVVGLVSARTDTLGLLVSAAWTRRESEEQGYNAYRWGTVSANNFGATGPDISGLPQAMQDELRSGDTFYAARGNRLSSWNSTQYRLGITAAAQWQPSDTFHLTLDGLYGQYNQHRQEMHIATQGSVSSETALNGNTGACYTNGAGTRVCPGASVVNAIHINDANEIDYLDVSNTKLDTETRIQLAQNKFYEGTATADWTPSDRLTVHALAGYEYSTFNKPYSVKFQTVAHGGIITDYSQNKWYPTNTYDFDTSDPANFSAASLNFEQNYLKNKFENGKIDLDYRVGDDDHLRGGFAKRRFTKSYHRNTLSNYLVSSFQNGTVSSDVSPYYDTFSAMGHSWVTADVMKALDYYGVDWRTVVPDNQDQKMSVVEDTWSGYLQYDFSHDLAGVKLRGNVGLRYYNTDQAASGALSGTYTTTKTGYDGWLPAANLVAELTPDLLVRGAYSKNVTRNDLTSLVPTGTAGYSNNQITVSAGNPYLMPYKSDNFDLGVEFYMRRNTSIGATAFYKHIKGYPGTDVAYDVPWSSTGLPTDALPGVAIDDNTIVTSYSRPVSLRSFNVKGIELFAQSDFFFLPAPFDKFGAVTNLTIVDSKVDYATAAESATGISYIAPLQGLSKVTANATLYYENSRWGARLSGNYRSSWWNRTRPQFDGTKMMDYGDGWAPTIYVDANAHLDVSKSIRLTLDAINLTGEIEKQWAMREQKILLNRLSAGSTYLFGVNFKL